MLLKSIVLENVHEVLEDFDVKLVQDEDGELFVVTINEDGYNSTWVEAKALYKALKDYFEKE